MKRPNDLAFSGRLDGSRREIEMALLLHLDRKIDPIQPLRCNAMLCGILPFDVDLRIADRASLSARC
jgi:hypothetical protein